MRALDHRSQPRQIPSMIKYSEQLELLSSFLSMVLTRSRVTLVSYLLRKEQDNVTVSLLDYVFCCSKKSLGGWGWIYRSQKSILDLKLATSRVRISLSKRVLNTLYEAYTRTETDEKEAK